MFIVLFVAYLKCLCVDSGQLDEQTLAWLKRKRVSLYVGYEHVGQGEDEREGEDSGSKDGGMEKLEDKNYNDIKVKLEE
jgi:hypothetical protein